MRPRLQFIETIEEIRESLVNFNNEAAEQSVAARSLLTQTKYWVYDPVSNAFGPSKFVGLKQMTIRAYDFERKAKELAGNYGGTTARSEIAKAVGRDYEPDDALAASLDRWGRNLIPDDPATGSSVFDGVDRQKWVFIALPEGTSTGLPMWLFQAAPTKYDLQAALQVAPQHGMQVAWKTGKWTNKIKKGHGALLWVSGTMGGIVATGVVISDPGPLPEEAWEAPFHLDASPGDNNSSRLLIRINQILPAILPREEVKADPVLAEMSIFRFAQESASPVRPAEAAALDRMIGAWLAASCDAATQCDDPSVGVAEGWRKLVLHLARERRPAIVKDKKLSVKSRTGRLQCEACGFDFAEEYGQLGEDFIECHHRTPLAGLKPGTITTLADLALVCANCHRMLHRGQPAHSVESLHSLLENRAHAQLQVL